MVTLREVSKRYGSIVAVDHATLEVVSGECLVILGPSGSGKTTLLRLIAGLERPDHGEIWLGGSLLSTPQRVAPPFRRGAGMVFQDLALWPHLTVEEHLDFVLRPALPERTARRERMQWVLEAVNLKGRPRRLPRELSGGEQQRLALARAIASRPALLLLDEPLGSLDPWLKKEIVELLSDIRKRLGTTVLYVTHEQPVARLLADRIAVLYRGRIEQVGPLEQLLQEPRSPFVRDFLVREDLV